MEITTTYCILAILGAVGLVFRGWVVQIKLEEELKIDRGHLSRMLSYTLCLALLLGFTSNLFTVIVIAALPTMILAFAFYDIPFYIKKLNKEPMWQKNKFWVVAERITLHPPLIIAGVYAWMGRIRIILTPLPTISMVVSGIILTYGVFFLFDPRIRLRQDYPSGLIIFVGAIAESIVFLAYLY